MTNNNNKVADENKPLVFSSSEKIKWFVGIVTSWAVGIIFLNSGFQKIFLPYNFLAIVYGYEITSPFQGYIAALVVPWLEITLGMLLISCRLKLTAWLFTSVLLAVSVYARVMVLLSGLVVQCGCYGIGVDVVNWYNTGATILILVVALISLSKAFKSNSVAVK
ncbi:MAG: hypothetical protein LBC74_16220 [Planctomycetaceae bacterium]|jgi:hypothetical protein|nr:hypothetical protein [Planctomycetaceae bacterium]